MKLLDFQNYLFRCSSLGKLMTSPRNKKDLLSATTKKYLQEIHKEVVFGKTTDIQSKYLDKGKQVEDESIEMYGRIKSIRFQKNEKFYENKFVCGTPDIVGENLVDIKSSWDFTTFPMHEEILPNKHYYWQMQGYMGLTKSKKATIAYCLVDTPPLLIQDEVRRLSWNLGMIEVPDELESEVYERLQYADIPEELRVKEFHIEYNDEDVKRLYERIEICRDYLTDLSVSIGSRIPKTII